jgi:hypothetical protein
MGARGVFRILAVSLAVATIAVLIATKRLKSGWLPWLSIPFLAFLWYWVLVGIFLVFYMSRIRGVR